MTECCSVKWGSTNTNQPTIVIVSYTETSPHIKVLGVGINHTLGVEFYVHIIYGGARLTNRMSLMVCQYVQYRTTTHVARVIQSQT